MEIKSTIHRAQGVARIVLCGCLMFFFSLVASAQPPVKSYTVKNGKMYIHLDRLIGERVLDSFLMQYNLADIGLRQFIRKNVCDSLRLQGWDIERNDDQAVIISKPLMGFDPLKKPGDKMVFFDKNLPVAVEFP